MRLLRVLRQRARSLFRGANADAELARELDFHLEQLTRENIASGMDPAAARRAARRTLGGVAQIEEQCRDHRRVQAKQLVLESELPLHTLCRLSPAALVEALEHGLEQHPRAVLVRAGQCGAFRRRINAQVTELPFTGCQATGDLPQRLGVPQLAK